MLILLGPSPRKIAEQPLSRQTIINTNKALLNNHIITQHIRRRKTRNSNDDKEVNQDESIVLFPRKAVKLSVLFVCVGALKYSEETGNVFDVFVVVSEICFIRILNVKIKNKLN